MSKKPILSSVLAGYGSASALNANFVALRDAFDNTLSLDGSTPNAMGADLDMNSNDILNTGALAVNSLTLAGVAVTTTALNEAGLLRIYSSKASLEAATVGAAFDLVYLTGYYSNGDGGGAFYKRVGSAPSHSAYITSGDGAFWELNEFAPNTKQFGAKHDDSTDDSTALANAIDWADQEGFNYIRLADGILRFGTQITVPAQFTLEGGPSRQTGSDPRASTLRWTGGASSMFISSASLQTLRGFAVDNFGTATSWLQLDSGAIHNTYEDLTFVLVSGANRFSDAIIKGTSNVFGYSKFLSIYAHGASAPKFASIDGNAATNGCTPIYFDNRCIFVSTTEDFTVLFVDDVSFDAVYFNYCTFNQTGAGELRVVDNSTDPRNPSIFILGVTNCEFDDDGSSAANDRFFILENVENFIFSKNHMNGGGVRDYAIDFTNSHCSTFEGNYVKSVAEYVINVTDSDSTVRPGYNELQWSTVKGIYAPVSSATGGVYRPTWGASIQLRGDKMDPSTPQLVEITATDTTSPNVSLDLTKPGYMTPNQMFVVMIKNESGGAMGTVTFNTGSFKTTAAFTSPADNKNRSVTFIFDGSNAIEIGRVTADVDNA